MSVPSIRSRHWVGSLGGGTGGVWVVGSEGRGLLLDDLSLTKNVKSKVY